MDEVRFLQKFFWRQGLVSWSVKGRGESKPGMHAGQGPGLAGLLRLTLVTLGTASGSTSVTTSLCLMLAYLADSDF